MSVYTTIDSGELKALLGAFELGQLVTYEGITDGIENTNYFVTTTVGEFVLTIFEDTSAFELPYFLNLMAHLAERGVLSARPMADKSGCYLQKIKGKPTAFVTRLAGSSILLPTTKHCAAIGTALARMHLAMADFPERRANGRGVRWQKLTTDLISPKLTSRDRILLEQTLQQQQSMAFDTLPTSVIHADLFRDNALFEGLELSGIIDFYYAHDGPMIYDLAVTMIDWCYNEEGEFIDANAYAVINAYQKVRSISCNERSSWKDQIRAASLRFWLSRLKDRYFPRVGMLTHTKDPEPFRRLLLAGQDQRLSINQIWE